MKNVYFFTGFPGFICNKLIREVWLSNPGEKIILLTLPQMLKKAEKEVERLVTDLNLHVGQVKVILGDITEKSIFQDKGDIILRLVSEVTHVYHLAAIYDLAVAKDIAYRVNVEGTRNLTNWVKNLPHLVRYTYFYSICCW
jgi:nucleoside-diphosphate-sugar epimerase